MLAYCGGLKSRRIHRSHAGGDGVGGLAGGVQQAKVATGELGVMAILGMPIHEDQVATPFVERGIPFPVGIRLAGVERGAAGEVPVLIIPRVEARAQKARVGACRVFLQGNERAGRGHLRETAGEVGTARDDGVGQIHRVARGIGHVGGAYPVGARGRAGEDRLVDAQLRLQQAKEVWRGAGGKVAHSTAVLMWQPVVVLAHINLKREADLPLVGEASNAMSLAFGFRQRGQ